MFFHVVLFSWKDEATEAEVDAFVDGLAALPGKIPEIRSYRFGPDAGLAEGHPDFALVAEFDDVDAYRRYADHPAHRDFIERRLRPIVADRHAVQFST